MRTTSVAFPFRLTMNRRGWFVVAGRDGRRLEAGDLSGQLQLRVVRGRQTNAKNIVFMILQINKENN